MKRIVTLIAFAIMITSCMGPAEPSGQQAHESAATGLPLRLDKYQGEEPTTPEATEIYEPVPPRVIPGEGSLPPSDAIVLFDGSHMDHWQHKGSGEPASWILNGDGSMTVRDQSGDIATRQEFGSIQLHLEWSSPAEIQREGQNRGNSGVFLQERYEVQILDNNDNPTYVNGQVASIYKQFVPLAMASRPSGEWNTYDIIFHAPEFTTDSLLAKAASMTVLHNGVLVQDHRILEGTIKYIGWPEYEVHGKAPIVLQDHGDNSRVSFRNIWVREL